MIKAIGVIALMLGAHAAAAEECLAVNSGAAKVAFEIVQDGAPFQGVFHEVGGTLCLEADRITRIDVWLEPASVDTGLPELDAALQEPEFFDTRKFARVEFVSDEIRATQNGFKAGGELRVKGRQLPVAVPFTLETDGGQRRVSGNVVLDRLKLGIGTGEWSDTRWLGREVTVSFEAALREKNGRG